MNLFFYGRGPVLTQILHGGARALDDASNVDEHLARRDKGLVGLDMSLLRHIGIEVQKRAV